MYEHLQRVSDVLFLFMKICLNKTCHLGSGYFRIIIGFIFQHSFLSWYALSQTNAKNSSQKYTTLIKSVSCLRLIISLTEAIFFPVNIFQCLKTLIVKVCLITPLREIGS